MSSSTSIDHESGGSLPTRRELLRRAAGGFGLLALGALNAEEARAARRADDPLAPKPPHFAPRAKNVIFLFMPGGVSHVDTFDPKPLLDRHAADGKKLGDRPLLASPWKFTKRGECGTEVSELFQHVGELADELCVLRSMRTDHGNHFEAVLGMHTGSVTFARPSIGSWLSYGLGTDNAALPSFVVLAPRLPYAGTQVWSADFLPACHQGVRIVPGPEPLAHVEPRVSPARQSLELDLLRATNRRHLEVRGPDSALEARIRSFETAFAMQTEAPALFDLRGESNATLEVYGLQPGRQDGFGWQCLMARRLVERGVRFVELIDVGASNNWDAHGNIRSHEQLARNIDRPIAALLRDLRSRGLLDETLVVWTTEFGRTPQTDKPDNQGRGHHPGAFSSWLAGGGVRGGYVHGATDEYGRTVVADEVHVHDLHATILHLCGLDHTALTFRHGGRDYRLTDVHGNVVEAILA